MVWRGHCGDVVRLAQHRASRALLRAVGGFAARAPSSW